MKKHNKLLLIILSFLIPFSILSIIFSISGFFSDKTVIYGDMHSQYYPLFTFFKNEFGSIFLSFNKGLGETMFGTFFYYLSSPFNLLMLFFNKINMSYFLSFLIIFKIGLSGLTMYLYMRYKYKHDSVIILAFSLCYAFMGYNLNYYINIMWLDIVFMAPIVLMGLDKLINGDSPILYVISLFISIFSNYYISYMLCIFCVLYFLYEVLIRYNFRTQRRVIYRLFFRFLFFSFITGLMCSFFLIPCIFESSYYSRTLDIGSVLKFDYNFFDLFSKSYIGSIGTSDILNYSSMNVYCGIVVFPLVYFYLTNNEILKKERFYTFIFIIFMVLPCFVFPLNYVWHLFSQPSFYSYRFSFLLCFLLINIAYKSYSSLNANRKFVVLYFVLYLVISFYFCILCLNSNYYGSLKIFNIILTFILLIFYIIVLLFKNSKVRNIIFTILLFSDIILNACLVFNNYDKKSLDILYNNNIHDISLKYSDGRLLFYNYLTLNDSIMFGYNGVSNFLSTSNGSVRKFYFKMSYIQNYDDVLFSYRKERYILDSLIGLKYFVSNKELNNYKLVDRIDDSYVYENPNALSIGYIVKDMCNDILFSNDFDQKVYNCLSGDDSNFYKKIDFSYTNNSIEVKVNKPYSFYVFYPNLLDYEPIFNSSNLKYYSDDYLFFENNKSDYKFDIDFGKSIDVSNLNVLYFDYNKFSSSINFKEQLNYKIIDDKLIGDIDTNGGIMMLTIPYKKGFNIIVDGEKVPFFKILNAFVGVNLSNGIHHIEVSYNQPGLILGCCISIFSFILFILYLVIGYFRCKKN